MDPNQNNIPRPNQPSVSEPMQTKAPTPTYEQQSSTPWPGGPAGGPPPQSVTDYPVPPAPERKSHKKPRRGWRSAISTIALFLLAPFIALFIATFVIQSYQVEGASMEKTLQNGDRLIVSKVGASWSKLSNKPYIPHRGDIIIFNQTGLPDAAFNQEKQLIKRVIGLPGERVVVKDGKVTVYNQDHPEGFNPDSDTGYLIASPATPGNVDENVQDDQIFVLGDNRTNSEDSRYFGPVGSDKLVGKLILRILPIDKAHHF